MIPAKCERLRELVACLVKLEVACSRVELLVLDDVRLRVANVPEHVVVEVEPSLVDAFFPLALAAHAKHGPKLPQFLHFAFVGRFSIIVQIEVLMLR